MESFETFLENFKIPVHQFSFKDHNAIKKFIQENELSKILDLWSLIPESFYPEIEKNKHLFKNKNFGELVAYDDNSKIMIDLIDKKELWCLSEQMFQERRSINDDDFSYAFRSFIKSIFFIFNDININGKNHTANFYYALEHMESFSHFNNPISRQPELKNKDYFIQEKLIPFIENHYSPFLGDLIYFLNGNLYALNSKDEKDLSSVVKEFEDILNKIIDSENDYTILIDIIQQFSILKTPFLKKIISEQKFEYLYECLKKTSDQDFNYLLEVAKENLYPEVIREIFNHIENREISKDDFMLLLPHMNKPYFHSIKKPFSFSDEEIEIIIQKFDLEILSQHLYFSDINLDFKNYIAKTPKKELMELLQGKEIDPDFFPENYFLDIDFLNHFEFSRYSDRKIYNEKNFHQMIEKFTYEKVTEVALFFPYLNKEDKQNMDLFMNFFKKSSNKHEILEQNEYQNMINQEIFQKHLLEQGYMNYINFKPLSIQLSVLEKMQSLEVGSYQMENLKKFLNNETKIFLELSGVNDNDAYHAFKIYLEDEYVKQNSKINIDKHPLKSKKQGIKL